MKIKKYLKPPPSYHVVTKKQNPKPPKTVDPRTQEAHPDSTLCEIKWKLYQLNRPIQWPEMEIQ